MLRARYAIPQAAQARSIAWAVTQKPTRIVSTVTLTATARQRVTNVTRMDVAEISGKQAMRDRR